MKEFDVSPKNVDKDLLCAPTPPGTRQAICVPQGQGNVTRVVTNELISKPPINYRLIRGENTWQWHPLIVKVFQFKAEANKEPKSVLSTERKFASLWKYDDFTNKWTVADIRFANRNETVDESPIKQLLQ
jgi:hypothetical protein